MKEIEMNNLIYVKEEDLKGTSTRIEENIIFPASDSQWKAFDIDFYNLIVNRIDIRNSAQERTEICRIIEECYNEFYKKDILWEYVRWMGRALSFMWSGTPQLGFKLHNKDVLKRDRKNYLYEDAQNNFGGSNGIKMVRKIMNVNVVKGLSPILKRTKTLDKF